MKNDMGKVKLKITLLFVFFACTIHFVSGQQNNSLYFLDRVPQSIQLNPALQPGCVFYFGIPVISSLEINAGNNFFGLNDAFFKDNELGKFVNALNTKESTTQALNKLRKNNIISAGINLDLISFGFKLRDSYISFLISDKVNINTNIPKDLIRLPLEVIDVGSRYSLDNIGLNASYYREYSIGYSKKINDQLFFGVRGKMLFGKANITSQQTSINIYEPNWQSIELSSSINVQSSIPHLDVYTDKTGKPDSLNFRNFPNTSNLINDVVLLRKNRGFGFDLGIQFLPGEKFSISASILDLGYINWKTNVNTLSGGGDYTFKGINLNETNNVAKGILDSLLNVYDATLSYNPYNTLLIPKLYVAVSYAPVKSVKFGLLSRSEYIFNTFRQQFTGTLTLYPVQFLGVNLSYTIANRMYDNLGIGFVFRSGPLQYYIMSERIPVMWYKIKGDNVPYLPVYAKDFNLRFGANIVIGANKHKALTKDQPFLE